MEWVTSIGPLEGAYDTALLNRIDLTVRGAARWNGNKVWERQFKMVTTDLPTLRQNGFDRASDASARGFHGVTYTQCGKTGIWLAPGYSEPESIDTGLHEWSHGICAYGSSHDVSWRRLFGLAVHMWSVMCPDMPLLTSPCILTKNQIWHYTNVWYRGGETYDEYTVRRSKEQQRICNSASRMCLQMGLPDPHNAGTP
jgi:hypothetical protein